MPSVTMMNGIESTARMGFKKKFTKRNTSPAIKQRPPIAAVAQARQQPRRHEQGDGIEPPRDRVGDRASRTA